MTASFRFAGLIPASTLRRTRACVRRIALLLALPLLCTPLWGQTTTVSGTVYVPNASDPLPNALVYVTTGTVAPFVSGAQCPGVNCQTFANAIPANAIVSAYSAADGTFTLQAVPENTTYTLVIQAGKWRRQFSQAVATSPITGLALVMPTTHAQGDIPLIAISTGSVDATECVLRDVGVADAEFTDDIVGGGGRIHLYTGNLSAGAEINASTPSETVLMGTGATLNNYDMAMFPCQGNPTAEASSYVDNLLAYTSAGGRVMATHYSLVWLDTAETYMGATFNGAVNWLTQSSPANGVATINTSFTDGATLAQWIQDIGDSFNNTLGQISISTLRHDTTGVIAPTQIWLTLNSPADIMQLSFNTPLGAAASGQYGRVLYNEYHVEAVSESPGTIFPAECGAVKTPPEMSPQEKMLEYALFDLSNFVVPIVVPTVSMAITTSPSDAVFTEGDTADTVTVDVTNTGSSLPLDLNTVLAVTLPAGLTATAMADTAAGGWLCNFTTVTCTRGTPLAPLASDSVVITVTVAGNATGGSISTTPSVSAVVSNPTFSSSVTQPLTITIDQHAAATWATPAAIADGTPLSGAQLNAVGNTAGTYVYNPPSGTVLAAGSHTLSVTFTPTNQELYPGTATVTVTQVVNSAVAASASAPAASDFGSIPVASSSGSQSVTFTFLTPGIVGSPSVVTEGAAGQDFTDAVTGTCDSNGTSYVYSPGNTCTVNLIFTPRYPGTRLGAVLLEDGSGNVLATAYVSGTGTGPELNFLPGLETFAVTGGNGIVNPQGLALDGYGNLYTADYGNQAVYQTTPAGVTTKILDLTAVGEGGTPESLAVDGAGNLYIADSHNNQVLQATPSGGGYTLNPSPVASGLNSSGGVAVDPSGNVYVADTGNNRILLETRQSDGTYVQSVVFGSATSILGSTLNTPFDVAVDTGGNLYISDTLNNRVIKESFTGETYIPSLVAGGLDWPTQLIIDGEGNVFFANNGHSSAANAHIYKETPSAGSYIQTVVPISLTASNLWGVAVGGNGSVYFSDVTDTEVIEENFASAPSLSFATTNVGSTSSDSPQAVTLENIGNAALALTSTGLTAPADFSQVPGSGSPVDCADSATVAAGASCDLSLQFAPGSAGDPLSELFELSDNSLNAAPATQNIALHGIALAVTLSLSPSNPALAAGTFGVAFPSLTFTASGGTGPYTYSYTGTLPPGLTLSAGGVLSGTPTSAGGPFSFTVVATDSHSVTGSQTYSLSIAKLASVATLISSANPALAGGALTFTATVATDAGAPTGTVTFLDGTTVLGQGTLVGGVATLTTSALAGGSHLITAVYSGTANFVASTSAALTESVIDFSLNSTTFGDGGGVVTAQTVSAGGTATYPLIIVPDAGIIFPTPITLTVTGMPPGATATITPTTWTVLTGTSWLFPAQTPIGDLSLIVQLPTAAARAGGRENPRVPAMAWAVLLLPFAGGLGRLGKRKLGSRLARLGLLIAIGATVGLGGCATSGFFAPNQATYTITVTATSGPLSHSTTLTLTVKQ
jgi:sugar lactone lactonase YvrE